ncbi:MAG: gliding motility protein GldM [Saprospiraceae bacterium]|nr:gliding motility protein GldM [Saprospiraceae bacterium]
MSIPKEPRQLMINVMYIILTALLALNVSAEIFNAFKVVNKGLEKSNESLDKLNEELPKQIAEFSKKKAEFAKYAERTDPAKVATEEFTSFIDGIIKKMVDETGGMVPDEHSTDPNDLRMKGYKDKEVTTRVLVNEGKGAEIEKKLGELKEKLSSLFDDADKATNIPKLALDIDPAWKQSRTHKSWAAYNFSHMPLGAALPILNKLKNDAKSSEAAVLNYLMNKIGATTDLVFDKFQVVSASKKSYVVLGEKFETDIFLSSSSSNIKGMSVTVNGASVPNVDGVAKYSVTATAPGIKKYNAKISLTNPVTKKVETYSGDFEYEVGLRSATVSPDKMNVFYVGVDNPITVAAAGVSSNDLKVSVTNGTARNTGRGKYDIRVSDPGATCTVTLSGGGLTASSFPFRIKRIPSPVAYIANKLGGALGNGQFAAQRGIEPRLEGFEFDARCEIQGFVMTYVARRQDPVIVTNPGGTFGGKVKELISRAKPGDMYIFDNVKAKCPGDNAGRNINSLSFNIR